MAVQVPDTAVKKYLGPAVVVLLGLLTVPGYLAALVAFTVVWTGDAQSSTTLFVLDLFAMRGVPTDIAKTLLATLPALVVAISFRPGSLNVLTRPGKLSLLVLVVGGTVAFAVVAYLNPDDSLQASRLDGGVLAIQQLRAGAEASLRYSLTYVVMLLGFQVEVTK